MNTIISYLRSLPASLIPHQANAYQKRYMFNTNSLFVLFLFVIFLFGLNFFLLSNPEIQQVTADRTLGGLVLILGYFVFLKSGLLNFSRFYLTLIVPIATLYLPLFTKHFSVEYFIKGPYQPLICLLVTLWSLHPKKDAFYFWTSICLQIHFPLFSWYWAELAVPGSLPESFKPFLNQFSVNPLIFYLTALVGGITIMLRKEKSLDHLNITNQKLIEAIEENQIIQDSLNREINRSDRKIQNFLYFNSHNLRLPVSNLMGLQTVLKNEILQKNAHLSPEILTHLEYNIHQLNKEIERINKELDTLE